MISGPISTRLRRRISTWLLGAIALLALGTQPASAVVLTFDAQTPATGVGILYEQGFEVTASGAHTYVSSGGSAFCTPACPNDGSNHLLAFDAAFDIAPVSAGLFSISQLDIAESHQGMQSYWARAIRVIGTFADNSTVSVDLQLDFVNDGDGPLDDFQTEYLPAAFSELVSVRIEGINGQSRSGYSIDNVVLSERPVSLLAVAPAGQPARPVSEPATLLMIVLGLLGLGLARRSLSQRESLEPDC